MICVSLGSGRQITGSVGLGDQAERVGEFVRRVEDVGVPVKGLRVADGGARRELRLPSRQLDREMIVQTEIVVAHMFRTSLPPTSIHASCGLSIIRSDL